MPVLKEETYFLVPSMCPINIFYLCHLILWVVVVAVYSLSRIWLFVTPLTAALQASLPFTVSWSLLKLMSIELVIPSKHFILHHSFLLPLVFPSIRVFSNESAFRIRWPKYWSFSFSTCLSRYSGLISFRVDWFDLLAIQGTLNSLLQHQNLKASILPALSLLHSPTLTSIHDYWKNHSFD